MELRAHILLPIQNDVKQDGVALYFTDIHAAFMESIRTYALQLVVAQFIAFSPACGGVRGGTGDKSPPFRESETYYKPL